MYSWKFNSVHHNSKLVLSKNLSVGSKSKDNSFEDGETNLYGDSDDYNENENDVDEFGSIPLVQNEGTTWQSQMASYEFSSRIDDLLARHFSSTFDVDSNVEYGTEIQAVSDTSKLTVEHLKASAYARLNVRYSLYSSGSFSPIQFTLLF
jgi:hypothetical protein